MNVVRRKTSMKNKGVRLRILKKYRRLTKDSIILEKVRTRWERKGHKANLELIEFFQKQGPFPLMALPRELISNIFSVLHMKDRLRVRVNKKLNEIEAESKYEVEELRITEQSMNDTFESSMYEDQTHITFFEEQSYSSECIRRIARNASIKELQIRLTGSSDFHREVYNLIKEFDIGNLFIRFGNKEMQNEILVDSFLLGITNSCKIAELPRVANISSDGFYQLYQGMIVGAVKLEVLFCESIKKNTFISLLALIGITLRDGNVVSARNDIKVYEHIIEGIRQGVSVVHELLEMRFFSIGEEIYDIDEGIFCMTRMQNQEKKDEWMRNQHFAVRMETIPE
ncbi:hypothetical protein PMAYCL1PPCAC_20413 [Pristionchus mayeri]|uniref:F-box domain-containing protein n=1 Tax=Pristionchus mayeri TaxID=1317129 RepID=A0AAN5I342_9BILA|nr:hypothetical protein PMAYCL1PPCAC_20413 [Pristionchus mayeri]